MKTIYLSIMLTVCVNVSVLAQIGSSTFFSDTIQFNMNYSELRSNHIFEQFSDQTPTTATFSIAPFASFNRTNAETTGDGWLIMPGEELYNAQKIPVGYSMTILIFIALSYAATIGIKRKNRNTRKKNTNPVI